MKEKNIFKDMNQIKKTEAELLAIFDPPEVYLVGDMSIKNLRSIVLELLIFIGEYAIDNCNYRTLDVAEKIVAPVVSNYKTYLELEYERYKKNPEWLQRKKRDESNAHYKCQFLLAILKKETIAQGNISLSDFNLLLDNLIKEVSYSLFREHSFNEKEIEIFLDDIIRLAFKIISKHYIEESIKKIDDYLENLNKIQENIPDGNKKVYINQNNNDIFVIGVFKDGKLIEGTKNVIDLCTGKLYELEVENGKETGKRKGITYDGIMFCEEVKGENCKGRIIYPNGNVYIGEFKDYIMNGQGRLIYNYGEVLEGNFIEGKANGKAKIYCEGYTCYYILENDKILDETGKLFLENGNIYECEFKDSKPFGKIKAFYPNGDIYELENFEDENGKFIENKKSEYIKQENWCKNFIKFPKQKEKYLNLMVNNEKMEDIYIGKARNNNKEENVILFKNGDIYMGQIENNKKEGYGRIIYYNGEIYVGNFKNDKRDGTGIFIDLEGAIYKGNFENGEMIEKNKIC